MASHAAVLVELGAILLCLGLLGRLASRLRITPIPFYLLLGLAFGKGGLIPFGASHEFVQTAAEIGVVILLLMLGLEYSAHELHASLRANFRAGLLDFVLNFSPGFLLGVVLRWDFPVALMLGGVTYVSSSGIVAKLLGDLNRLAHRETPTILSLLVFEDLAMALFLPVTTGILMQSDLATTIRVVMLALSAVAFVFLLTLRFGERLNKLIGRPNDEVLLLLTLGLTLVVAGVSEQLHISAGVGAFLVGIALSDRVAHGARELLTPLRDLFAATFFVFFGLQTDPSKIPSVLLLAVALAIITSLTKLATGWYAATRNGIGRAGRLRAGASLIARGEFSIVIAGLAVASDVPKKFGALVAAYVLIVAIAGPLLTRFLGTSGTAGSRPTAAMAKRVSPESTPI